MADLYTGKNDAQMAKDIVSTSADLYLQKDITPDSDIAVLDKTTPATSTLTPIVSPTWTINELAGNIIMVQTDDEAVDRELIVISNTADAITVDLTSDFYTNDVEADFTDAGSFSYKLFGAEEFLGHTDPGTFTDEDETKVFEHSLPIVEEREDLVRNTVMVEIPSKLTGHGAWTLGYNLVDGGSNATYYVLAKKANPASRPKYFVVIKNQYAETGKTQWLRCFNSSIKATGANPLGGTEDSYQSINLQITVFKDPISENKYIARIEK